jgi:membrane-associated phospholipid phosphatase
MKHMNELERILAVFGACLAIGAVALSVTTEVSARNHLAEYRNRGAAGPTVIQQGAPASSGSHERHIGYEQQTLASRWSIPDGHATLGAGFAFFGVLLVAVPRATARKRAAA